MKLDKRKGDLTKMDLEKVTVLEFIDRDPLSDLKPLSKLTKLKRLRLEFTQVTDFSRAVAIRSNPKRIGSLKLQQVSNLLKNSGNISIDHAR